MYCNDPSCGDAVDPACGAGIVEAWTSGVTWDQVSDDCTLEGGDLARLLSRTMDMLRQVQHTSTNLEN